MVARKEHLGYVHAAGGGRARILRKLKQTISKAFLIGTAFGAQLMPAGFDPIGIFIQPPGAFLVIALFIIIMNAVGIKTRQRQLVEKDCDGRCGCCAMPCEEAKPKAGEKEADA